jgi:hypothetical protein
MPSKGVTAWYGLSEAEPPPQYAAILALGPMTAICHKSANGGACVVGTGSAYRFLLVKWQHVSLVFQEDN